MIRYVSIYLFQYGFRFRVQTDSQTADSSSLQKVGSKSASLWRLILLMSSSLTFSITQEEVFGRSACPQLFLQRYGDFGLLGIKKFLKTFSSQSLQSSSK
ncbi:hypothetical protein HanIR_Chr09g0432081 [Helianthus annuus]|nr:hypothetical protein HanIR_Chr09g0432081 [Helianthus annuus]